MRLFLLLAFVLAVPFAASAQSIADFLDAVPKEYAGGIFAAYLFAFYIVGPICKRVGKDASGNVTALGKVGEWITQDSHRPPSPRLGILLLALAGPVMAQDVTPPPPAPAPAPAPAFGGSTYSPRFGLVTFGPSAALTMAAYNPKDGKITSGFKLAPGYGVNAWADKWYVTGLSGSLLIEPGAVDAPARAAVVASFAQYVRVGWSKGAILVGIGVGP